MQIYIFLVYYYYYINSITESSLSDTDDDNDSEETEKMNENLRISRNRKNIDKIPSYYSVDSDEEEIKLTEYVDEDKKDSEYENDEGGEDSDNDSLVSVSYYMYILIQTSPMIRIGAGFKRNLI